MEPAGTAIGILGLAALFNTAVDDLNYVRVARALKSDFKTILLDLESIGLKLSRWGAAIGLDRVDEAHQVLSVQYSGEELEHAKELLQNIIDLLREAEEKAAKSMKRAKADEQAELDAKEDVPSGIAAITSNMRKLKLSRTGKHGFRRSTAWALFRRSEMESLITSLRGEVKDLTDLFPASREARDQLTESDANEIVQADADEDAFKVAQIAFKMMDSELEVAVSRALIDTGRGTIVNEVHQIVEGDNMGVLTAFNHGTIVMGTGAARS